MTKWMPASFLTVKGDIPNYQPSSTEPTTTWTTDGSLLKNQTLALVGFHVVGSVKGHPELVWATFEQQYNSPNASYYYANTSGQTVQVPPDTSGNYTFNDNPASSTINNQRVQQCNQTQIDTYNKDNPGANITACIEAVGKNTIGDSYVRLNNPWGSAPAPFSTTPALPTGSNPCASTSGLTDGQKVLCNNTDILSANHGVMTNLAKGDKRASYALIGGVWTNNGSIPTGSTSSASTNPHFRGSFDLANSTLETFTQQDNCFSCHSLSSSSDPGTDISHIFSNIVNNYKDGSKK